MNKYEAMIVLDTKGKEETVDQIVASVTKELEKAGAKLEQVDNLGKRKFPFNPRHVEAGYFININFQADAKSLDAAREKLRLNDNIYQQYYQRR
jgi:small subunit ribosomal protein S6